MDLSPYTLEPLHMDGELFLYRGVPASPADGGLPGVLVVAPVGEDASAATVGRLEHEYALAADLDPRWAVRPAALGRHQGRPVLVLEDPGGEPLDRRLGQPMEVGAFLRLAISLARAVGSVHAAGLIHKDLKPAHVLVNSATGQVWLTGFGIASRLPRERQSPGPPETIAGTLAYMAPEQTGRMNRSVDARSDLYALGVTFYQMLTGVLPFTAADPMEWVHCHIARRPAPPAERVPAISRPVSAVIMKLLAKTAEERYQTAAGLESDLRHGLAQWEAQRRIDDFPLGRHDTPDRLLIPETLYAREREVEALLAAFGRVVTSGTPELVLVSGHPGIGKSSVVNALHKVLVPRRGLFASGKFVQYKRDIPYAALAQAFQRLIRGLLAKSDADLTPWRDALREALGPNGQLMVDLVPELKLIVGAQPPAPELPLQDAQGRFQLVVRRFVDVFAQPAHPLVLFLDDLQWLDAATLDLLEDWLTRPDLRHLLLIGAYRDNEVTPAHPLMRRLAVLRQTGVPVQELVLPPLGLDDVGRLIADALHCPPERVEPLDRLVHDKTGGNPFFITQFLTALAEEGVLAFEQGEARWAWDLEGIQAKGFTDNVVELMLGRLSRLPAATQAALRQLACLGPGAALATLSLVHGGSESALEEALREAVSAGLVYRREGAYRFLHDRIREAAYSLIPAGERAAEHLRIGRRLAAGTPPKAIEENVFEIVSQLHRGAASITTAAEREQVAELNLKAGRRAKAATAYAMALAHFVAGEGLLAEDRWERHYALSFGLALHRAECEFLTGEQRAAEARLAELARRAVDLSDLAAVIRLQVELSTTLDRSDRELEVVSSYLRRAGIELSAHPTPEDVKQEYARMWQQLGDRPIEALVELPRMADPVACGTMEVLTTLGPWCTSKNLRSLIIGRMVNLSLEHGNSDASCLAYVQLVSVLGLYFGDYEAGYRFGQLSVDLVEKRGLDRYKGRVYLGFGSVANPWKRHVRTGRLLLRKAFDAAQQAGDFNFATFSHHHLLTNLLASGDALGEVQREAEAGLDFARQTRISLSVNRIIGQVQLIRTLRGLTSKFGYFDDAGFDEERFERHLEADPRLAHAACWYWIRKLQARVLVDDHAAAIAATAQADRLLWTSSALFEQAEYHFYAALARASSCDAAAVVERTQHLEALAAHHRQLRVWAENCPENFENRAALVGAEFARLDGRELDAERLYEQAIHSARESGFVHNEAIAYERAAAFYRARGFDDFAETYLRKARACYARWGADGKVRHLDRLYPHLGEEASARTPTSTIAAPVEDLDLATVIKVSQAVSGEIVLENLIDTLMRTAIEEAGAERGLLILPRGVEQRIHAEATTTGETVAVQLRDAAVTEIMLPESVLHYVLRTRATVILDDAAAQSAFTADPYIRQHQARSVLCLPLLNQAKLIGVLYLENNLAARVFAPARTTVLKLLASQAAISLDNSRLYAELQEREAKVRQLVDANVVGVVIADLTGPIIEANDAFLDMVGYSRDDLVAGRLTWTALTPPEWQAAIGRAVAQIRETGRCESFEREYIRKDGSRVPTLVAGAAFEGTRSQSVAFVVDLSERKRSEEALQRAHAELAHATRVTTLGELAASIAHEVNQPLAAIVTDAHAMLNWLAAERPDLEQVRQALDAIVKDGHRAAEVIQRIRQLATKTAPERVLVDLNELIQNVVPLVRAELRRHEVSLAHQRASELPPVFGDRVQLQQVILNLVMNAIEAMAPVADRPRELVIRSELHDQDQVLVAVQDTGVGIAADHLDRLFSAFFTTKPGGMGLGLAISRSIVEAQGGRLWATPNEPHGAIVQFSLPGAAGPRRQDGVPESGGSAA